MRWCFSCSLTVKEKFKKLMCIYTVRIRYSYSPPWKFCQKRCFKCKASWAVFWPLPSYKELKRRTTKPFTGCTLGGLLIPIQNISFQSSGMHRKQNFYSLNLLLLFAFSPLLFFCFSCLFFFLLLGILVTVKVLGKTLRIFGLDERRGRTWVVE